MNELFTEVELASGWYLPRRFTARWISTANQLHFGEWLLIIIWLVFVADITRALIG